LQNSPFHTTFSRVLVQFLIAGQISVGAPPAASAAARNVVPEPRAAAPAVPAVAPAGQVNRTVPVVQPLPALPVFSLMPSDQEIFAAGVLPEPLVPVGGETSVRENRALAQAITAYARARSTERVEPFLDFLAGHPRSPWRTSVLTGIGIVYRKTGYISRALAAWEEAWALGQDATDPYGRAIAERAVSELAELSAGLGRLERANRLFAELEGRDVGGSSGERLLSVRRALFRMERQPETSFRCGPFALERVHAVLHEGQPFPEALASAVSTKDGTSLEEMAGLAGRVGLGLVAARRLSDVPIPTPAVVHWKSGHFAALVEERNGSYRTKDPTFGPDFWVSAEALNDEASGYFLVDPSRVGSGWRQVEAAEARPVRGKGVIFTQVPPPPDEPQPQTCPPEPMAAYAFKLFAVGLRVVDTPVNYTPPRGPAVHFEIDYNQREISQPGVFNYPNFGPKWTFTWLSYVEDNTANLSADVKHYASGGGESTYTGFPAVVAPASSEIHRRTQAKLVRTAADRYELQMPDGSVDVFAHPLTATGVRKLFMTQRIDPRGQSLTFTYDASHRLVAITDAIGQVTTVSYGGVGGLQITQVTDPFGRAATFNYDGAGRLVKITDVIGIMSEFTYGSGDFISSMTTPYGTTRFQTGLAPPSGGGSDLNVWVEATDPLGGQERVEFSQQSGVVPASEPVVPKGPDVPGGMPYFVNNAFLWARNTYYWNKRALMLHRGDYTKAHIYHWVHGRENSTHGPPVLESEKAPLEGRVWYQYLGQTSPSTSEGTMSKPIAIGRVLDEPSPGASPPSQIVRYEYNAQGQVTRATDPLGRETVFEYDVTGIDRLRTKQKNPAAPGGYDLLETVTYNGQHLPVKITDAAGQSTDYTYNAAGQVLTETTPLRSCPGCAAENRTTTWVYDDNGYLVASMGPLPGAAMRYTYDAFGRVRTSTDSDGYTLVHDYDALDRSTRTTFPDGTYQETVYNRLDPQGRRDRLGRWSHVLHDALRRVVSTRDPEGNTVNRQWCTCGSLDALVDGRGSAVRWDRDLQGRVTRETRADQSYWEYTYEATTSRLKNKRDAKGQDTQTSYFLDDSIQQVSYPTAQIATPSVSYTYESAYPRKATRVDALGTTFFEYHPVNVLGANRLATVNGPFDDDTLSYGYDELGREVTRALTGPSVTWQYDALERVTSVGNPTLGSFTFGYVGGTERVASLTYPNGQATTFAYFPNGGDKRIQEIHHRASAAGATLSKLSYGYDPTGNVTVWTQQYGAGAANAYDFKYDGSRQLASATYRTTGLPPVTLKRYGYAYDAAGNRTTEQLDDAPTQSIYDTRNRLAGQQPGGELAFKGGLNEPAAVTVATTPAVVGADNQFEGTAALGSGTTDVAVAAADASGRTRTNTYRVTVSGSPKAFTHDLNGSITSDGTRVYEWDGANRLVRVLSGGSEIARFVYDGQGRRAQKISGGVTRTYIYDGDNIIEERPGAAAAIRYVHGPGIDRPLASVQSATASYFLADHLGSILQVTNGAAAVTLTRQYDPWGNPLQGSTSAGYAYTGREWDPEVGLYFYRARYYDPKLGRFLSEDPLGVDGPDPNVYAYVGSSPIRFNDPHGLSRTGLPDPPLPCPTRPKGCTPGPCGKYVKVKDLLCYKVFVNDDCTVKYVETDCLRLAITPVCDLSKHFPISFTRLDPPGGRPPNTPPPPLPPRKDPCARPPCKT
jgi:RHS repeat-associated protein